MADRLPRGFEQVLLPEVFLSGRAEQFDAGYRCAILAHSGTGTGLDGDPSRLGVLHRDRRRVRLDDAEDPLERHRVPASLDLDRQEVGRGPAHRVGAEQRVVADRRPVDHDRLHADIERAGIPRSGDARLHERQELVEDAVLQVDRQREEAVQPALYRRQFLLQHAILVAELEAGAILELAERGAGQLARVEQVEPADERGAGVLAFEVVGRVEQVLPACLPLAAGQRAEAVEAAGDGAGEAQLALAVGRDGPEQRRAGLMRAVGAPEALDGPVGAPARLQQEVDALLLVFGVERGVVGPAGPTRVREDEDALAPFHERRCFDLTGSRRA